MRVKEGNVFLTGKAKQAVDSILVGKPATQAVREAGYKVDQTKDRRARRIKRMMDTKGVQFYLKRINQALEEENAKFLKTGPPPSTLELKHGEKILPRLVIKTYVEGLNATKLYGKNANVHPDFKTRILAADRLAEFFSWRKPDDTSPNPANYNQFNFFSATPEDRGKFDSRFKEFIKLFYNKKRQD